MAKEVSEKSLELNLCAEMLHRIRSWRGCDKALWFGLTQKQERREGLDARIRNTCSFSLMLQFKAPWETSQEDDLYKFSINERQHAALEQTARCFPHAVYYVLPLYSTWSRADQHALDLLRDTWFVPVSSIPGSVLTLPPRTKTGYHRVELDRRSGPIEVRVFSPRLTTIAINAKQFFDEKGTGQSTNIDQSLADFGISSEGMRKWLRLMEELEDEGIAPRFRGLNTLTVPVGC